MPRRLASMANQIPVIAVLMIVQGALEVLMGLLIVAMAPVMYWTMTHPSGGSPPPAMAPVFMVAVYIAMGLPTLGAGVFRFVAAARNLAFRGRTLGIVSLAVGALSMSSCYCFPTSLALLVYGLVVYVHEESVRAFELGEQGLSPAEIRARLRSGATRADAVAEYFR